MGVADILAADLDTARDDHEAVFRATLVIGGNTVQVGKADEVSDAELSADLAGVDARRVVRVIARRSAFTSLPNEKDAGTLDGETVIVFGRPTIDPQGISIDLMYQ